MRPLHVDAITNFQTREHTLLNRRVDVPAVRRDGQELIVALSVASVERRGETVFFASVRDITARVKQQKQLRELNTRLEQRVSERTQELEHAHRQLQVAYRDLEAFSRSVSHDLRAPLRAIQGYAGFLTQSVGSNLAPAMMRDLDAIGRTARHMNVILDNLLKLASVSQSALKPEEFLLGDLVRQVVEEFGPRPDVRVHVEYEQLGCVCADPGLLALALRNLIGNAMKFSATQSQPEIRIGAQDIEGERSYFVRDNGVGFDPRYADRLFGAFQRLHSGNEFEGTGLGLTIVKSVIEKNRGRVWAESTPGEGATFYFYRPVSLHNSRAFSGEDFMRVGLIAGLVLAALGAFVVFKGVSYTKEESVFKFGGLEAKMQQKNRVPEWIGGVALGAGLVLVIAGLKKR
jgi:signal transduction histidine kinase